MTLKDFDPFVRLMANWGLIQDDLTAFSIRVDQDLFSVVVQLELPMGDRTFRLDHIFTHTEVTMSRNPCALVSVIDEKLKQFRIKQSRRTKSCVTCGQVFLVSMYEIETRKYCSRACLGIANGKRIQKPTRPGFIPKSKRRVLEMKTMDPGPDRGEPTPEERAEFDERIRQAHADRKAQTQKPDTARPHGKHQPKN